jgi:hypothetical protein
MLDLIAQPSGLQNLPDEDGMALIVFYDKYYRDFWHQVS